MSSNNLRKKATQEQKELITSFLSEHEGMRTRKFSAEMTYQKYQDLWRELADKLNSLGPSKNVKDWQKYWNDQRSRVKRKAAVIKQNHQKTGGGIDESVEPLTAEDERILQLMGGQIVVSGDNYISEAGFPIINDDSYVECVIGLEDIIKEESSFSSKEQPATTYNSSFDKGTNAVLGQRHDLDRPKTPKNFSSKEQPATTYNNSFDEDTNAVSGQRHDLDCPKTPKNFSSKEQPATTYNSSFDEGTNAVSGQRHDLDRPKTPKNKKRKFSEGIIDKELLLQSQMENNNIQRQIAETLKKRNGIEEKKLEIKEKKLAALILKNKLEEKKIDAINNLAEKLLNFIPSSST